MFKRINERYTREEDEKEEEILLYIDLHITI
jgi:hypothetical protein